MNAPAMLIAENYGTWGVVPCWFCKGRGVINTGSSTASFNRCEPCLGVGRLRWVQPNLTVVDNHQPQPKT